MISKLPDDLITMEDLKMELRPFTKEFGYCTVCGVESKIENYGKICAEYTKDPTKTCSLKEAWDKQ